MGRKMRRNKMDNHEKTDKDKKIDETIKIAGQIIKGLHEKDRTTLEAPYITNFIETNFGIIGKQYYEKIKESYLKQ